MPYPILKGSTGTPIVFGPVILSSDHIMPTGDLHTTIAVQISVNGGALGTPSGAISWIGSGWYAIAGNATDTASAGPVIVHATVATADPFDQIVANIVDPAVAVQGVNAVNIGGTAQTARDLGASVLLSPGTGTGQVNLTSGVVAASGNWNTTTPPTVAAIATGVWQDTTAGDFTAASSIGKSVMNGVALGTGLTINGYTGNTPQTGDAYARIGAAGAGLTALGDTRIAYLDASILSRAVAGDAMTLTSGERNAVATALLTLTDGIETGFTLRRAMRIIASATAGKVSGGPAAPVFRNMGDTQDQITGAADSNGNRTASTFGA